MGIFIEWNLLNDIIVNIKWILVYILMSKCVWFLDLIKNIWVNVFNYLFWFWKLELVVLI